MGRTTKQRKQEERALVEALLVLPNGSHTIRDMATALGIAEPIFRLWANSLLLWSEFTDDERLALGSYHFRYHYDGAADE